MPGRRETVPGLDDLAAQRAALAALLQQLEARPDGGTTTEQQRLRSQLRQLDREILTVAGAN